MSKKKRAGARIAERKCATCGNTFTWTSRNPKRRFCEPACKARWWRLINGDATSADLAAAHAIDHGHADAVQDRATVQDVVTTEIDQPDEAVRTDTPDDAVTATGQRDAVTPSYDPYVAGYGNGQPPSAVQTCPNCLEPVAVINLLVTSTAAYVNTPSRSVTYQQEPQ